MKLLKTCTLALPLLLAGCLEADQEKLLKTCTLALPLLLAGCLEADQHPRWINGEYAGKKDQRPYQERFHNDRLAWWATVENRNLKQNEYNRTRP